MPDLAAKAAPSPSPELLEALSHHQSGRLAEAEAGYRRVLAKDPDDAWAMHLLSLLHLNALATPLAQSLGLLEKFLASANADQQTIDSLPVVLNETLQINRFQNLYLTAIEQSTAAEEPEDLLGAFTKQLRHLLARALTIQARNPQKADTQAEELAAYLHEFLLLFDSGGRRLFVGDRLASMNKSCGFLDDDKFMAAFERNAAATGEEPGRAWRLHTLTWAAQQALKLDGDFVECGVFEGFLSSAVAEYVDFAKTGKTFHLYDTFEGFSEKYSSPEDFGDHKAFFEFAQQTYSRPGLYEAVVARFSAYPNIKVIRGVVPDVLIAEPPPERIAYCHIDLNSPAAEVGALEVLFDRIVPGGMVIFDDYGWLPFAKQKEAEDEFAAARGYTILELPTGQGLLVKR